MKLALREGGAIGTALGFYLIVVSILSIGIGPDLQILSKIAPGVLWGTLMLSALLSVDRIFHNDYEDGTLEVIALGSLPLELVVVAKSLAHWISTAIPLVLIAPVLGMFLNLPAHGFWVLMVSMLAGTPAVSFLGAVGAGLTLGLGRGGQLLSLLILPLYIPRVDFWDFHHGCRAGRAGQFFYQLCHFGGDYTGHGRFYALCGSSSPSNEPAMSRLVTIARFYDMPSATCAKSLLDACHIPCFLHNDDLVRLNWHWIHMVQGIKLHTLEEHYEDAIGLLASCQRESEIETARPKRSGAKNI